VRAGGFGFHFQAESPGAPVAKKEYTLEDSDPFWLQHSTSPFPKVAEEVETGLQKYKADVAEVLVCATALLRRR